ncbi:hypothetical protein Acr_12g0006040 [Actinidia rufa]|uniref:Uncharacterized protein n=1 Tax=Actinidia rufa TaxID=165716 RepID=A0A7J0FHK1_9ERIC|nr:hypothetical protein Acr_12g0006040 [Actinidia rufa]
MYEKLLDLSKATPYILASTHMTLASPCEVLMTSPGIKGRAHPIGGPHGGTTWTVITDPEKCGPLFPIKPSKAPHHDVLTAVYQAAISWQTSNLTSGPHALRSCGEDRTMAPLDLSAPNCHEIPRCSCLEYTAAPHSLRVNAYND